MDSRADRIFAGALADLEGRMGVKLADMLPGEIAALVHACDREADPWREANADAIGVPVRVCEGVWFWRLTIGAAAWLSDVAEPLCPDAGRYRMCLVHALVHAREPEAFAGLDDWPKIRKAVAGTARSIFATPQEVDRAIERVIGLRVPVRGEDETHDAATDWAGIAVRLETQTGIPASEWIWKRSSAYAMKSYSDLHAFARAHGSGKSRSVKPALDELDAAVEARQALKVKIAKRVKAEKEAKDGDR